MNVIALATAAATEAVRMSRLYTCMSSWPSTPRSSRSSSSCRMPSVAQTAALRGLRPVAKALGAAVGRDVQPRHGLAGGRGELAHDAVHHGLLGLADRPRPHGPQGQLVGVPVAVRVHAQGEEQGDEQPRATADQTAHEQQEGGQAAQQQGGLESVEMTVTHGVVDSSVRRRRWSVPRQREITPWWFPSARRPHRSSPGTTPAIACGQTESTTQAAPAAPSATPSAGLTRQVGTARSPAPSAGPANSRAPQRR